ncbi:UDP-glucose 4-epimerase [Alkalibacillus filiformis]|uniref:UDP-glucose 4-epimerase n=1 Tax=Alkalibacillus filiformis TaxID=200990 RepID=A0ABU0DV90_9BACI|nr:SDR family oxidoreductase [Alkalibacillus filiformis]MDQ0352365.1 UDP-glucose 4-epimerase [Alkalibacillus filiformis]
MNILITGAMGYIGSQLVKKMMQLNQERDTPWQIIATDIKEKADFNMDEHVHYIKMDVRSPQVLTVLMHYEIDTVIHLATIVTPGKKSNREFEYSVDVEGTQNILEASVDCGIERVVITSSGAAYGYHPDNAEWIKEDHPIRGNEEFAYSYHKRLVEEMLADYRRRYPQLEQVIFRIGTILGENVDNQITDLFKKKRLLGIKGSDSPFVFIWDQDVIACLIKAIESEKVGIYNVAGDGALTVDELANILDKKVIRIPVKLIRGALFALKRLRLTQYGEEQVNFLRYRPVLDNTKLKEDFGYKPTYTSEEVFREYVRE